MLRDVANAYLRHKKELLENNELSTRTYAMGISPFSVGRLYGHTYIVQFKDKEGRHLKKDTNQDRRRIAICGRIP